MQHLPKISITVLITIFLGLWGVPGCRAIGHFSTKSFTKDGDIVVKDRNFEEDLDLTGILEFKAAAPGVMKAEVTGQVVFENCQFYKFIASKRVNGVTYIVEFRKDVVFNDCVFRDTMNMDYVMVEGDFFAGSCEFLGPASFDNAWFKGRNAILSGSVFYDKARFINAVFENKTRFFKTEFSEAAMFQSAVFKGASFWGAASFQKYAEFGKSRFLMDLDLGEATFKGTANFNDMVVLLDANLSGSSFAHDVDFSKVRFSQLPLMQDVKCAGELSGLENPASEEENR